MAMIRLLRVTGETLAPQAGLYGQLVRVEWAQERRRLLRMLLFVLAGFAGLLGAGLLVAALVLAASWRTAFWIPSILALIALFAGVAAIAWARLQSLSRQGDQAFSATFEELGCDLAAIRSRL